MSWLFVFFMSIWIWFVSGGCRGHRVRNWETGGVSDGDNRLMLARSADPGEARQSLKILLFTTSVIRIELISLEFGRARIWDYMVFLRYFGYDIASDYITPIFLKESRRVCHCSR
jgi:hypothetical protein